MPIYEYICDDCNPNSKKSSSIASRNLLSKCSSKKATIQLCFQFCDRRRLPKSSSGSSAAEAVAAAVAAATDFSP